MSTWFWFWLILAVGFAIGEIFTTSFFLLPFSIGAAVAGVFAIFGLPAAWQWAAFLATTGLLLPILRHFSDRVTHEPPMKVAGDRLIGRRGVVVDAVSAHSGRGTVRVDREEWRADAPGFEPLESGVQIEVVGVEGTHLIVKPADDEYV
ncbi:MAG: NfeD family protein [Coriobacteriales bacterium]|nr:NfeD family protein [Coriobacteriales bacterium]